MNIIPRSSWQDPAQPVKGPPRAAPFSQGVVHWEGIKRDVTPSDIAAYLRQMQGAYVSSRGYSLGYGYACITDARHRMDGSLWEIRGRDINMASNPGRKWNAEGRKPSGNANDWTGSVLLVGPTGVHVSDKAAASVRDLFADWHAEAGTTPVAPFPHSELDYTDCCGDAFRADLAAGLFIPTPIVAPLEPPTPIATEEPDMLAIDYTNPETQQWTALTFTGSHLAHVVNGHANEVIVAAQVKRVRVNDVQLDGLIESSATTTDPPPEFSPARKAAWVANRA